MNFTMKKPPFVLNGSPTLQEHFCRTESICFDAVMKRLENRPKRVAIDVGFCEGLWSLNLAQYFDKVHAYEPNVDMVDIFAHQMPDNVYVNAHGLSDKQETYEMVTFDKNVGMSMRREPKEKRDQGAEISIEEHMIKFGCRTRTFMGTSKPLDEEYHEIVDFIKIDAEGDDHKVIQGAWETIKRCRPLIFIDSEHEHNELESLGYTSEPITIAEQGLRKFSTYMYYTS